MRPWSPCYGRHRDGRYPHWGLKSLPPLWRAVEGPLKNWQLVAAASERRRTPGNFLGRSWYHVGTQDVVNMEEMCPTETMGRNKIPKLKSQCFQAACSDTPCLLQACEAAILLREEWESLKNLSPTAAEEVGDFGKGSDSVLIGPFRQSHWSSVSWSGKERGKTFFFFLVFCLATQTVENSSVVGFAWLSRVVLFGVHL